MYARFAQAVLLATTLTAAAMAPAAGQPAGRHTLVVPYGPGGATDAFARLYATELASRLGSPVVVENTPGAGGTIAIQKVTQAAPDGRTLVVSNGMEMEMLEMADPANAKGRATQLTPVSLLGTQPMLLVVRPTLDVKTTDEFVAAARARPGGFTLASSGPGTSLHLAGEMIQKAAGIELLTVPYKSGPQIATDLMAGNVDAAVMAIPTVIGQVRAGGLRALAVTGDQRSPALPDVPSLAESIALRDVDARILYAIYAPPQMPPGLVQELADHSAAMLAEPGLKEKMVALALTPAGDSSPAALQALRDQQLRGFQAAFQSSGKP